MELDFIEYAGPVAYVGVIGDVSDEDRIVDDACDLTGFPRSAYTSVEVSGPDTADVDFDMSLID